MDYKLIMNTAVLAGEIMLKSGAETHRVEDTMYYILRTSKAETVEANVTMTGIVATIEDEKSNPVTVIKRVQNRGTNLNRIMEVNNVSRDYCAGKINLEEAYNKLKHISGKQYSVSVYNIATVLIPTGFALLFGGGFKETAASALVGIMLALIMTVGKKLSMKSFILNMLSSFGIAVTAIAVKNFWPTMDQNIVIISGIMPLVPGVVITNAIRDTLEENYISGAARILEAFVIAAAVALGVGVGMAFMAVFLTGGV